jgi:hypothetical protein
MKIGLRFLEILEVGFQKLTAKAPGARSFPIFNAGCPLWAARQVRCSSHLFRQMCHPYAAAITGKTTLISAPPESPFVIITTREQRLLKQYTP